MKTIGFIGLGLIGGSIAKTIRKFHPDYHILAYAKHKETLAAALNCNAIDAVLEEKDERYRTCDYIFLGAPVEYNIEYLKYLKNIISDDCIITDAGSVKGPIHKAVEELGMDHCFIGGHPMAGSEQSGFEHSSDHLLENAYYILTPGGQVPLEKLTEFSELIDSLGSIPMVLTAEEHDFITAGVSHLPHIVAATLVNALASLDTPEEQMKTVAAGGFKDITRIASSSPEVWQQICLSNQKQLSNVLDSYIRLLVQAKYLVDNKKGHELYNMFESSREYRNSMEDSSYGPTKKEYVVYCDLLDEAGGIAAVTTILAINQISIKNIGITHNREFEEGALRIEFYEEQAGILARKVLKDHGYTIHIRN